MTPLFSLIKTSHNVGKWGTGTGKSVIPSSLQRFPTPATRGDTRGSKHTSTAHYNYAGKTTESKTVAVTQAPSNKLQLQSHKPDARIIGAMHLANKKENGK